jgi:hypothetical protein
MFAGFFDESTDENNIAQCYTVAGYFGAQDAAAILDLRWGDLLRHYDLAYYKASEIQSGWGEFRKHREHPKGPLTERDRALQREMKNAFLSIICDDDALRSISASVSIPDWNTFSAVEPELKAKLPSNCYTLCSQIVLMEAGLSMFAHNDQVRSVDQGVLKPIFDSHYEYEPIFRQAFPSFKAKNPKSSRFLLQPEYEKEQDYRCLQAARSAFLRNTGIAGEIFHRSGRPCNGWTKALTT